MNVVLAVQMLWYWNSGTKLGAKKEKKHYPTGGKGTPKPKSGGRKKA